MPSELEVDDAFQRGRKIERERCAKIAETCMMTYALRADSADEMRQMALCRRDVAAAIRHTN